MVRWFRSDEGLLSRLSWPIVAFVSVIVIAVAVLSGAALHHNLSASACNKLQIEPFSHQLLHDADATGAAADDLEYAKARVSADDVVVQVWANGVRVDSGANPGVGSSSLGEFEVLAESRVAVWASDFGPPSGLRVSFEGCARCREAFSAATTGWRCVRKSDFEKAVQAGEMTYDWWRPDFDDSAWPAAAEIATPDRQWTAPGHNAEARWIWAADCAGAQGASQECRDVLCRGPGPQPRAPGAPSAARVADERGALVGSGLSPGVTAPADYAALHVRHRRFRVAVVVAGLGKKHAAAVRLIHSARGRLLTRHEVKYVLITDRPSVYLGEDVVVRLDNSTERFRAYDHVHDVVRDFDYAFALVADMVVVDLVGDEVLGDRVGTMHPGFIGKRGTYEANPASTAFVRSGEGIIYYVRTLIGGVSAEFNRMVQTIADRIEADARNGVRAVWEDESHVNRYFVDNPPAVILSPAYSFPDNWELHYCKKIIALSNSDNWQRRSWRSMLGRKPRAATV